MAGIYIHIPFCKKRCNYCNFYSLPISSQNKRIKEFRTFFVNALLKEIQLQKNYLNNENISTIYIGGGTPSLLEQNELNNIFSELHRFFKIEKTTEITLEINPDDVNFEMLETLKKTPINRLSIGIQSFFDEDLKYLSRIHNASQAMNSLKLCLEKGFENLSIDLIYAIPTLSDENWKANLELLIQYKVPHISSYALTVEPRTTLEWLIKHNKSEKVNEKQSIGHYKIMLDKLQNSGYINYEISNFALKNYESKHNSNYWKAVPYLGLGPSAHSFNNESRQWNISDVKTYISSIEKAILPFEMEKLSKVKKYNEYVMTSLRTIWGCDLNYIEHEYGDSYTKFFLKQIDSFINDGQINVQSDIYCLSDKGKLFADAIAAELFFIL